MAKKETYYWNIKGEQFDGCGFGEDVTKHFENDEKRREEYLNRGLVSIN